MLIRNFMIPDFDDLVRCYQRSFPMGHNRYTLARLARFQKETIFVATENDQIIGMTIGISSQQRAWITATCVLPDPKLLFGKCSIRLVQALMQRFAEFGYTEFYTSTARPSVRNIATMVGAKLVAVEKNFFFDGEVRWIYQDSIDVFPRLGHLLSRKKKS